MKSEVCTEIYLEAIEAYLRRTDTAASRLCMAATGSPNHVSRMRARDVVAQKHVVAILRYMDANPGGPPKVQRSGRRGGRPKRVVDICSTGIPVLGPSQLPPTLFEAIKTEAFHKRMTVVQFMEDIMKLGWQHYIATRQEAA